VPPDQYDSFGNTVATTGTLRNYFQYTGREFDTETNLYFQDLDCEGFKKEFGFQKNSS
jgi:hypothetical protein